jgi:hypothetical protein
MVGGSRELPMWANRETKELYIHVGINDVVDVNKIVRDAFDDVHGDPGLWDDFERQALRTLATNLRAHIEGVFEDFYFGDETKRTPPIARMCSDAGSLWRIDWTGFARALFEDGEYKLEANE